MDKKRDWSFVDKKAGMVGGAALTPEQARKDMLQKIEEARTQNTDKKRDIELKHAEILAKLEKGEIDNETAERMMRDLIK